MTTIDKAEVVLGSLTALWVQPDFKRRPEANQAVLVTDDGSGCWTIWLLGPHGRVAVSGHWAGRTGQDPAAGIEMLERELRTKGFTRNQDAALADLLMQSLGQFLDGRGRTLQ